MWFELTLCAHKYNWPYKHLQQMHTEYQSYSKVAQYQSKCKAKNQALAVLWLLAVNKVSTLKGITLGITSRQLCGGLKWTL